MNVNKLEKFSILGLKAFVGTSCAYGAYICAQVGLRSPLVSIVGLGLGVSSGVLLQSTAVDIYSSVTNEEGDL